MARGTQLLKLVEMLREEVNRATSVAVGKDDLPSLKNVSKVVVDEGVVEGHSGPFMVYKSEDARPAAAAVEEPRRAGGSAH